VGWEVEVLRSTEVKHSAPRVCWGFSVGAGGRRCRRGSRSRGEGSGTRKWGRGRSWGEGSGIRKWGRGRGWGEGRGSREKGRACEKSGALLVDGINHHSVVGRDDCGDSCWGDVAYIGSRLLKVLHHIGRKSLVGIVQMSAHGLLRLHDRSKELGKPLMGCFKPLQHSLQSSIDPAQAQHDHDVWRNTRCPQRRCCTRQAAVDVLLQKWKEAILLMGEERCVEERVGGWQSVAQPSGFMMVNDRREASRCNADHVLWQVGAKACGHCSLDCC
jgi:hypothetical protein